MEARKNMEFYRVLPGTIGENGVSCTYTSCIPHSSSLISYQPHGRSHVVFVSNRGFEVMIEVLKPIRIFPSAALYRSQPEF
jgi:hypothetical protein